MKKTITILFLFCSIISFGQISAARKLLLSQQTTTGTPFVLSIKSTQSISSNPTIAVFPPTQTVGGDLAILCIAANAYQAETFSTPAGWVALGSDNSNTILSYRLFIKTLSGGEQNSTVTINTSVPSATARLAVIAVIRDVTSSGDFDSDSPSFAAGAGTSVSAASSSMLCRWSIFSVNTQPTYSGNTMDIEGDFAVTGGNGCRIVLHSIKEATGTYAWSTVPFNVGYSIASQLYTK